MNLVKLRHLVLSTMAVSMLLLTGCSSQAGNAAVVGDQVISEREFSEVVSESIAVIEQVDGDTSAATAGAITWMVRALIMDAIAAENGITVTDAEVDQILDEAVAQVGLEELAVGLAQQGIPPSRQEQYARSFLLQTKISAILADDMTAFTEAIVAYSEQLGVTVSPRFGAWDVAAASVVGGPDDLSRPAGLGSVSVVPQG